MLAAEVAGQDEDEAALLAKADWYLGHGVEVVWLLFPRPRSVLVVTPFGRTRLSSTKRLARHASLSGLTQKVSEFFRQLGR